MDCVPKIGQFVTLPEHVQKSSFFYLASWAVWWIFFGNSMHLYRSKVEFVNKFERGGRYEQKFISRYFSLSWRYRYHITICKLDFNDLSLWQNVCSLIPFSVSITGYEWIVKDYTLSSIENVIFIANIFHRFLKLQKKLLTQLKLAYCDITIFA